MKKEIVRTSLIFLISFIFLFSLFYLFYYEKNKSSMVFIIEENVNFFDNNIYTESDMVAFNTIFKVRSNISQSNSNLNSVIKNVSNMPIERNSSTRLIKLEFVNLFAADIERQKPHEKYVSELNNYLEKLIKREQMGIDGEIQYINNRNNEIKEILDLFQSARFENFESIIKLISEKYNSIRVFDYIEGDFEKIFYSIQNDTVSIKKQQLSPKEMFLIIIFVIISLAISYLFLYYQRKKNINQS